MKRLLLALFYPLVWFLCVTCARTHTDPWHDMLPFWGERPGVASESFRTERNGGSISFHLLKGAEPWVQEQRAVFACQQVEPTPTDLQLIAALHRAGEPCTIWRSAERYDLEGNARYQAVQPTFICFANGDCLFYLYDWYNQETLDALSPPCRVLRRCAQG